MPGEAHVYFTAFSSESAGHVLCKIISHTTLWSRRFFLARYLPSNFIGKDGVRAKSQIVRFFYEPDRGPDRGEKKTRHFLPS